MSESQNQKLTHTFSGISVWLEPDPPRLMLEDMENLMDQCGGTEAGLHRIIPHCTLLYNTSLPHQGERECSNDATDARLQEEAGEEMLQQCLREYSLQQQHACSSAHSSSDGVSNDWPRVKMMPTSHYYFPYPTSADDGRGFGCCISLLILETTPGLKLLQQIVQKLFPPDERHRAPTRQQNEQEAEVRFQPHVALVYAPEGHENVTNGWLERHTEQMEEQKRYLRWMSSPVDTVESSIGGQGRCTASKMSPELQNPSPSTAWEAKYLSIWSTEGTLREWFPIAKVDLSPGS